MPPPRNGVDDDGDVVRATTVTAEEFFAGHPFAAEVCAAVEALLAEAGPFSVRITRSQVAFRRRVAFAFLWIPGRYLAAPTADVVLSLALGRHDGSPRFKEVAHPTTTQWLHHLEIHDLHDLDDEVRDWLLEAADRAG